MCALCGITAVPVCASGLCSANMLEFVQLLIISAGAGGGSILAWLQTRTTKNPRQHAKKEER